MNPAPHIEQLAGLTAGVRNLTMVIRPLGMSSYAGLSDIIVLPSGVFVARVYALVAGVVCGHLTESDVYHVTG